MVRKAPKSSGSTVSVRWQMDPLQAILEPRGLRAGSAGTVQGSGRGNPWSGLVDWLARPQGIARRYRAMSQHKRSF
jgi:hypothetical protein